MTAHSHAQHHASQRPVTKGFLHFARTAYSVWLQRRALSRLDQAALDDLGLTLREAHKEARKPIWSVPQHWLQ